LNTIFALKKHTLIFNLAQNLAGTNVNLPGSSLET